MTSLAPETVQLERKASLYSLLAKGFNYPDETLVETLQTGEFFSELKASLTALNHSSLLNDVELCAQQYSGKASKKAQTLLDLEKDYTRMFFATKPKLAHLFESVYREGKLFQESTFQIARLYNDAGLRLSEEFRLPPDHIAVELEFLTFLIFKEIQGINAANNDQVEFARELQGQLVNEHLGSFAASLAEKVAEHARTPFYKMLAAILKQIYSQA